MSNVEKWSLTANLNNEPAPDGAPDGWTGADVNDWGRESMRAVRQWYGDPEWVYLLHDLASKGPKTLVRNSSTELQVSGTDATSVYTAGMRVKIEGASTVEAFITSSTYTSGNTILVVNGNDVPAAPTALARFTSTSVGNLAFGGTGDTAARTAAYSSVPADGVVWLLTDTGDYTVSEDGSWKTIGHLDAFSNSGGTITLEHATNPEVRLRESTTPETRGILEWVGDVLKLQSLDSTGAQKGLLEIVESDEMLKYSKGATGSAEVVPTVSSATLAAPGHLELRITDAAGILVNWGTANTTGGSGSASYNRAFTAAPWAGFATGDDTTGDAANQSNIAVDIATSNSEITVNRNGGADVDYFWVVIGPAN